MSFSLFIWPLVSHWSLPLLQVEQLERYTHKCTMDNHVAILYDMHYPSQYFIILYYSMFVTLNAVIFLSSCRRDEGGEFAWAWALGYSDYDVFLENDEGSRVYRCKKLF
jgi:hypothetical protein